MTSRDWESDCVSRTTLPFPFRLSPRLIQAAVMGRPTLQSQLVKELVQFGDVGAAAHWAIQCNIPLEYLPFAVQSYLTSHRVRCVEQCGSLLSLSTVNTSLFCVLAHIFTELISIF